MMKNLKNSGIAFFILLIGMNACSTDKSKSSDEVLTDTTVVDSGAILGKDSLGAVKADSIPGSTATSDTLIVGKIRKALPSILEKQLVGIDSKDRQFSYFLTDLNGDGKEEQFVWFKGMNWCGSGGCTALLLSDEQKLITYFTVIDFPVTVLDETAGGWKSIVVYSGSANRLLTWKGSTYPKNPSVAPKFTGKAGEGKTFATMPKEWFMF